MPSAVLSHPARVSVLARPEFLPLASALTASAGEKPLLPVPMPAPVAPMGHKPPLMPLFRTSAETSGDGTLIQRSAVGESPTGDAHSPTKPDAADGDGQGRHGGGGGGEDSGGTDVALLAGEVWALLKRRLAVESERLGRH